MERHEQNKDGDLVREFHLRYADFHRRSGSTPSILYLGYQTYHKMFHASNLTVKVLACGKAEFTYAGMRVLIVTDAEYMGFGI